MSDVTNPVVPPEVLQTFGEAVARSIAAHRQDVGAPLVELEEGNALTGGFTLRITYGGTQYSLVISVPTTSGDPYVFKVTMKKADQSEPTTLVSFTFVDTSTWKVELSTPTLTLGPVRIDELSLNLSQGTPPHEQ